MSLNFVSASTQSLSRLFTGAAYPFTIGMWARLTTLQQSTFIGWGSTVSINGMVRSHNPVSDYVWHLDGSVGQVNGTTAIVAGRWYYLLLRCISTTNKRLAILSEVGEVEHLQETTVETNALSDLFIGQGTAGYAPANGNAADYFLTFSDIQPDGAQLNNVLLRQLAYRGPFSVSHIKKDIIEYRSFRSHPTLGGPADIYWGRRGVQTWTNTNGVTIGPHVPLSGFYQLPNDIFGSTVTLSLPVDEGDATVTVTGGTQVGNVLTATFNDDDPDGAATGITYQWERSGTPIGGETNSTYTLQTADVGETLTVVVQYTDGEGFAETIESAATATITAATGVDTKGMSLGKGLSQWKGVSQDKGLSWRKGV